MKPDFLKNSSSLLFTRPNGGSFLNLIFKLYKNARDILAEKIIEKGGILDEAIAYRAVAETEDIAGAKRGSRKRGRMS